ncbi:MAG: hypothetical protein IJ272_04180 [Clostridia bacterium]|nr:hypothetical protein [Clostridia bacterium]
MIDIHTHIIYDVDDGSDTIEESVAILKSAVINGVTDIILTPHYIEPNEYNKNKVLENFESLKREVEKHNIQIKLHFGNEVAIYGNISQILADGDITPLANSRYVLIEFPMNVDVSYVLDTIYEMRIKGLVPIIAHPERCECFRIHYDRIREAVEEGALIQCNTGSLMGTYGNTAKKIVKKLLKDKLVHFLATDTHSTKNNRYDELHKVEAEVEKMIGKYEKNRLFVYNARNILINENIEG